MKRDGGRQEQKKTEDKKKKIKQKVLHNHKQSHKFQKRENVGSLFFLPRYRKKTPKTCRSLSPLPRATSPLLNCSSSSVGRHALSRWSVVYFYCFFIFFLLLLIALFPGSSAQWPHQEHIPPPLPPPRPIRLPLQRPATSDATRLPPALWHPQPPSMPGSCDCWS